MREAFLFEHRFWLQVLGDHARFMHGSFAPVEQPEIAAAANYMKRFDELLQYARQPIDDASVMELTRQAYEAACSIRAFKLDLLAKHLTGTIRMSLPPTFINHMVNEVEEYIRLLGFMIAGQMPPAMHPLHHHVLWLVDAVGHAASI